MNPNTTGDEFAEVTSKAKTEGDCITDVFLAELTRRLQIRWAAKDESQIWTGAEPPTDRTKIWVPLDPITGALIGQAKQFNESLNQWVAFGEGGEVPEKKAKRRYGMQQLVNGNSVKNFEFASMGTTEYTITLTFAAFVDGGWIAAPANMNNCQCLILNRSDIMFTAQFYSVPAGGLSVIWCVTENLPEEQPITT